MAMSSAAFRPRRSGWATRCCCICSIMRPRAWRACAPVWRAKVIQLEALQAPLVLIESYLPGQQLPCVLGDNFTAGHAVMQHLLNLGHRSIAILRGPRKYSSLNDRLKGCFAAAAEAGILIPAEYMPHTVSGHPKKGYVQMQEILRLPQRPTAIVAISDKTAFGAMEAIKEAGLRIPEDIAIVS